MPFGTRGTPPGPGRCPAGTRSSACPAFARRPASGPSRRCSGRTPRQAGSARPSRAAAAAIGPGGLLVLTFSGHSERPVPGEHDGGWCLHDAALRHVETAGLLAAAPASARIAVIADTCYAAACAATFTGVPATTIVLAACAENQATLNYQHSAFVKKLERLDLPRRPAQPGLPQLRLAPPGTAQGHPRRRAARRTRQPPSGHAPAPIPARTPAIAPTPGKRAADAPTTRDRPLVGGCLQLPDGGAGRRRADRRQPDRPRPRAAGPGHWHQRRTPRRPRAARHHPGPALPREPTSSAPPATPKSSWTRAQRSR